jgi:hypothetical protein
MLVAGHEHRIVWHPLNQTHPVATCDATHRSTTPRTVVPLMELTKQKRQKYAVFGQPMPRTPLSDTSRKSEIRFGCGGKKQGFAAPRGVRLAAMAFVQWTPAVRIWLGVFPVQRLNACVNALKSLKPSSHAIFWRDLKVDNPSVVNTQHNQGVEQPERRRGDHEHVHRRNAGKVVAQKAPPGREGTLGRHGIHRPTVAWLILMPSLSSSP